MASLKSVIVLLAVVAVAAAVEDARDRRSVLLSGVAPLPIARAGIIAPGLAPIAPIAPLSPWSPVAPAIAPAWGHGLRVGPWGGLVI